VDRLRAALSPAELDALFQKMTAGSLALLQDKGKTATGK